MIIPDVYLHTLDRDTRKPLHIDKIWFFFIINTRTGSDYSKELTYDFQKYPGAGAFSNRRELPGHSFCLSIRRRGGRTTSYGIEIVFSKEEWIRFSDISTRQEVVERLAAKLHGKSVWLESLPDIVEDFLCDEEGEVP